MLPHNAAHTVLIPPCRRIALPVVREYAVPLPPLAVVCADAAGM